MARTDTTIVFFCATILCVLTLYLVGAFPTSHRTIQTRQTDIDCTTPLAKDLYGLGVRLGIYFQWTSGWVSNNFIPDEVAGGLDANSIFLFALLISIVNSTSNDSLTQIDAFIMLQLCAGTVWSVLSIWGYRTCVYRKEGFDAIRRFGGFGTHLRLLLAAAVSWYSIWFWTTGLKGEPHGLSAFDPQNDPICGNVVVFGLPIAGPVKGVTLGICIASCVYNVLLTAAAPLAGITRIRKMISFIRAGQYASSTRLRYSTGASRKQLHVMSHVLGIFNLIWMLFVATLIEITLNENHIYQVLGGTSSRLKQSDLLQPGQLLPMLIGTFSFIRCLFIAYELFRYPDGDISPSLGRHESKRMTQPQTKPTQGLNIFKLFSAANEAAYEEHRHYSEIKTDEDAQEKEIDPFYELQNRLSVFQRILVTWMPWLSLLWFWPWTEDKGLPRLPKRQHSPTGQLSTPHRTRYSDVDEEMTSMDKVTSHISFEGEEEQRPRRMV